MSYTSIEVQQQSGVRRLWLNRPQARNAQSRALLHELDARTLEKGRVSRPCSYA